VDRAKDLLIVAALLARIGLTRPELRAWAMYDWANSAFWTTVIVAVFPPFFSEYAAAGLGPGEATERFAWWTTGAVAVSAAMGPILGAVADHRGAKKRLLALFLAIGVAATLLMGTIGRGEWVYAIILFAIANVAVAMTLVFYESLLPHIAEPYEFDRVATAGYAVGFVGGGVLLLINLAWILAPSAFGLPDAVAAIKLSLVSVGVWWLLFSIPLLRRVPEPPPAPAPGPMEGPALLAPFRGAWRTFHELRRLRQAFSMLLAFLLYNDGIQTIIRMAAIYGTEVGINRNAQIAAFVLVQFVGIPCTVLFGMAADRLGPKPALFAGLAAYVGITILGYFMRTTWHFFALAFFVGVVQGGSQALSRSVFARLIPKQKSSEYFGFFSVFEKFAGIFGPALFAASITLFGSSRAAVLSVIVFFVLGALVLTRVDIAEGERQAALASRRQHSP
jgi:UMF1 family MFS transporter